MKQAFDTFETSPPKRVSGKIGLLNLLPRHQVRVFSIVFHISPENRISNTLGVQGFKGRKRFLKRSPLTSQKIHNFSVIRQ